MRKVLDGCEGDWCGRCWTGVKVLDSRGRCWTGAEGVGRVRKVLERCGRCWTGAEDGGQVRKVLDGCGRCWMGAEGVRWVRKMVDGCGRCWLDGCGKCIKITDSLGRLQRIVFNVEKNLISTTTEESIMNAVWVAFLYGLRGLVFIT